MKPTFKLYLAGLLVLALTMAACGDSGPEPTPTPELVNLQISYAQPGAFELGETKIIDYTLPQTQPATITATNVTEGWTVTVNTADKTITAKCDEKCPEEGMSASATLTLTAATGETATSTLTMATNRTVKFGNTVTASAAWSGAGTTASPWEIWSAADLKRLVDGITTEEHFAGQFFKLMVNVQVTADEWAPIGKRFGYYFSGSFDGNDMTISGTLQSADYYLFGIFGNVYQAGEIKNLTADVEVINNYNGDEEWIATGSIVGYFNATESVLSGCSASGTVKGALAPDDAKTCAGGIVGYAYGSAGIASCTFTGEVETRMASGASPAEIYAGGIVGYSSGTPVSDCTVADATVTGGGEATSRNFTGGLVGCPNRASISGCEISGSTVTGGTAQYYGYTGGVAGYAFNIFFSDCAGSDCTVSGSEATGTEMGSGNSRTGGFAGKAEGTVETFISDCTFAGMTVQGGTGNYSSTGGLCGDNYYSKTSGCSVTATVMGGEAIMGSITGGLDGEENHVTATGNTFSGTVTGGSGEYSYTGGLAGALTNATVHTGTHTGTVTEGTGTSETYTGGVAGILYSGIVYDCCRNTGTPANSFGFGATSPCTEGHTTYSSMVPQRLQLPLPASVKAEFEAREAQREKERAELNPDRPGAQPRGNQ